MRVCILHRYPISLVRGTNPSFPLFLRKLVARKHEVVFVSFRETENGFDIDGVEKQEISLALNRASAFDNLVKSILFVFLTPFIVRRINGNGDLDLVYCDDSFPFYAFLIKRIAKVKTIMRLGDLQSAYMFADTGKVGHMIFSMLLALEKITWQSVDRVVAISQAFKDFLVEHGIPAERIVVVPECVDLVTFNPEEFHPQIRETYRIGDSSLVMFHGLVARMKGLDTLLRAVPLVLKEKPATKFMIVGDGAELKRLKRLAKKLGIEESIVFTGWIPFSRIPQFLAACDAGVPMRSDNLGNHLVVTSALLQYWAMEKPVVAPNLRAMASVVVDGENGLLFTPGDHVDLSKKLVQILSQRDTFRNEVGGRGRIQLERLFNIDLVSDRLLSTLD